jgi:hypothetical protein
VAKSILSLIAAQTGQLPMTSCGSCSKDDHAAAAELQQDLLKEAYSAAACSLAALQSTLDGMDDALVAEVRPSRFLHWKIVTLGAGENGIREEQGADAGGICEEN